MSESVDHPLAAEGCACCPAVYAAGYAAEPAPVLGPYIGVVGAVLCSVVGAFLLLAPYAFDYRDGAAATPYSSVVDLVTGALVLVLGLLTAALFGGTLARRLRPPELFAAAYPEPYPEREPMLESLLEPMPAEAAEPAEPAQSAAQAAVQPGPGPGDERVAPPAAAPAPRHESEPETRPLAPAASLADPSGALRDLLTPLVAALAADLRARETGESEGKQQ